MFARLALSTAHKQTVYRGTLLSRSRTYGHLLLLGSKINKLKDLKGRVHTCMFTQYSIVIHYTQCTCHVYIVSYPLHDSGTAYNVMNLQNLLDSTMYTCNICM